MRAKIILILMFVAITTGLGVVVVHAENQQWQSQVYTVDLNINEFLLGSHADYVISSSNVCGDDVFVGEILYTPGYWGGNWYPSVRSAVPAANIVTDSTNRVSCARWSDVTEVVNFFTGYTEGGNGCTSGVADYVPYIGSGVVEDVSSSVHGYGYEFVSPGLTVQYLKAVCYDGTPATTTPTVTATNTVTSTVAAPTVTPGAPNMDADGYFIVAGPSGTCTEEVCNYTGLDLLCGEEAEISGIFAQTNNGISFGADYHLDQGSGWYAYVNQAPRFAPYLYSRFNTTWYPGQNFSWWTNNLGMPPTSFQVGQGYNINQSYIECKGIRKNKCNEVGELKRYELLENGTLTGGELTSQPIFEDSTYYIFDTTATIATGSNLVSGYNQATVTVSISDPFNLLSAPGEWEPYALTVVVNGAIIPVVPGEPSIFGINGGSSTITARVYGKLPGRVAGTGETLPSLQGVSVKAAVMFPAGSTNLICDGGQETFPISNWWELAEGSEDGLFGRINRQEFNELATLSNGLPACGDGHQAVGWWYNSTITLPHDVAAPIEQEFNWTGGDLQYKLRARGYSGYAYIRDSAGSVVANVFGDGSYNGGGLTPQWQLFTGTLNLDEGTYWLVLDSGPAQWYYPWQYVAYDDVSLGLNVNMDCDEPIMEKTLMDTPTPTPTNMTPSPSPTGISTRTVTQTTTPKPNTKTPTITSTARSTRTHTPDPSTSTVTSAPPTITKTPYGRQPPDPSTVTPGGPTVTNPAPWDGGDLPPSDGGSGNNPGQADCNKPASPLAIAGWVDYEFCRLFYAVSWQPRHSATMAAVPSRYNDYEPMASVNRMSDDVHAISTEASSYTWSGPEIGTGGDSTVFQPGADSPWNGGSISLTNAPTSEYMGWCSASLEDVIGKGLMTGVCFVINLLRAKQLLWIFQAVINVSSILIAGTSIYNIVRLRLRYQ